MPMEPYAANTLKRKCKCGKEYQARRADLARGWAKSCSKSCAAKKRN